MISAWATTSAAELISAWMSSTVRRGTGVEEVRFGGALAELAQDQINGDAGAADHRLP